MNMKMKIVISVSAICVCVAAAVGIKVNSIASNANISVTSVSQTVKKEEIFNVDVNVSSDIAIEKISSMITYDDSILEFVSCDDSAAVGASGIVNIFDEFETGSYGKIYSLTFKAIDVGNCTLSISDASVEAYDSAEIIDIAASSFDIMVNVNQTESSENRLADLLLAPQALQDAFSPDIYEYHIDVDSETTQIMMSAVPMDENAVITLEQPEELAFGENKILIHVTAISGDEAVYTLIVNRSIENNEESNIE